MSVAQKYQQGGTAPTLYNFYGKQYDYNDLAQAADQGLNEYLSTLSRGSKDVDLFREAYSNIMSGIKDGSIIYDNGSFTDSKGRWTNADKKAKDYYGLMANYIYGKMGKSNVYQTPKDKSKIDWSEDGVRTAVMRQLFNSDSGNIQDFLDLDEEKNGVRGLKNRAAYLANALTSVANNWDNTFQGYQDADKNRYVTLLTNAAQALNDGKIDPGDYLALSKAVGGLDFRTMLATGTPTTDTTSTTGSTSSDYNQTTSNTTTSGNSVQATSTNYKLKKASLNADGYSSQDIAYMTKLMSKVKSTKGLVNILRNSFYNRNYRFAKDPRVHAIFKSTKISSKAGVTATLNALYARNALKQADPSNPNLFYIPGLRTKRGTAWVWDRSSNQIQELQSESIPYLKGKLSQVTSHKRGGILYAEQGAQVPSWYDGISDFDKKNYTYEWQDTPYGMNDKGEFITPEFKTTGTGVNQNRYTTDPNYRNYSQKGRDAALAIEQTNNFKEQTDKILSDYDVWNSTQDKSGLNEKNNLFLRYTKWYDSQQPNTGSKFWNNDKLNTSWTAKGRNYYGGTYSPQTDIKQRIKDLRNDQHISIGHDNFRAKGTRYFYKDSSGNIHYVDPTIAKSGKYTVSTNGSNKSEGFTDWTDYELTGLAPNTPTTPQNIPQSQNTTPQNPDQSKINPTTEESKTNPLDWYKQNQQQIWDKITPLVGEARNLNLSLKTNRENRDILRKTDRPALLNPWEYHTPVTGDFAGKQAEYQKAAQTRQLAANMDTSDAVQNAANRFAGNEQAMTREQQGDLKDNAEILRTREEESKHAQAALQEKNAVANTNMKSLVDHNKTQGLYDVQKNMSDYQGKYNFNASNFIDPAKERAAYNLKNQRYEELEEKNRKQNFDLAPLTAQQNYENNQLTTYFNRKQQEIQDKYADQKAAWAKEHPDEDYTTTDWYKQMRREILANSDALAKAQYQKSLYDTNTLRTYYNNLYNRKESPFGDTSNVDYQNQDWYKILNGVQSSKRGGKLRLSTQYLLNKVIK